jgi:hypothetical protein
MDKVNCNKCRHYYLTWDKDLPRGCRQFHFKSYDMPSAMVKQNSGKECEGFEEKVKKSGPGESDGKPGYDYGDE